MSFIVHITFYIQHNSLHLFPTNRFSVFGHFVGLALKGLTLGKERQYSPYLVLAKLQNPKRNELSSCMNLENRSRIKNLTNIKAQPKRLALKHKLIFCPYCWVWTNSCLVKNAYVPNLLMILFASSCVTGSGEVEPSAAIF